MGRRTICCDFDGVLHSYQGGWAGPAVIPDPPVAGALDWIRTVVADGRFQLAIFSSRSGMSGGIVAMSEWLLANGLEEEVLEQIEFPVQKPPAFVSIDDRAIRFDGQFWTPDQLDGFKTWQQEDRRQHHG